MVLLTFYMITILQAAKFFATSTTDTAAQKPAELSIRSVKEIIMKLRLVFSFCVIIDSKYTGLITFLVSNILTGAINLSMNTLKTPDLIALLIILIYCFVSFAVPNLFFYRFIFKRNVNTKKTE